MKVLFLRLRVEDDLHDAVLRQAYKEQRSMNAMGNILLEEALKARGAVKESLDKSYGAEGYGKVKAINP